MNVGDLVVVVQKDRYGTFETWIDGKDSGIVKFEDYGDVIIYKPNGLTSVHPIIHRAIQYVEPGMVTQMKGRNSVCHITRLPIAVMLRGEITTAIRISGNLPGYWA